MIVTTIIIYKIGLITTERDDCVEKRQTFNFDDASNYFYANK